MNEKQAWKCFRETGSVEAYLRYARLVHMQGAQAGVSPPDSYMAAGEEASDADRDGGTGHPARKRGRKR